MPFIKSLIITTIILMNVGCNKPGGIAGTGPTTEVTVDGVQKLVRKLKSAKNNYAANSKDISGGWIDPNDYVRNIKAIEAVTDCKVLVGSVSNQGMQTIAAVEC